MRTGRFLALFLVLAPLLACGETSPTSLARGGSYETTLTLQAPLVNPDGIDRVVYRWSTSSLSQSVSMDDVIDLEVELYAGPTSIYVDTVRFGRMYRPMGGVGRSGLTWDFDFVRAVLTQMNNGLAEQQNLSRGKQYLISDNTSLQDDSVVALRRTTNGTMVYTARETLLSQKTVVR